MKLEFAWSYLIFRTNPAGGWILLVFSLSANKKWDSIYATHTISDFSYQLEGEKRFLLSGPKWNA